MRNQLQVLKEQKKRDQTAKEDGAVDMAAVAAPKGAEATSLLSILSEFHLADEVDQLAKDGIATVDALQYLDEDVIKECHVTPIAKGKLRNLAASLTSKIPSTNTSDGTAEEAVTAVEEALSVPVEGYHPDTPDAPLNEPFNGKLNKYRNY